VFGPFGFDLSLDLGEYEADVHFGLLPLLFDVF
jgi:hypothetical protein